ncbi:redox-sensitive transcriptional activator SoxR [Thalassovita taeanensis]|uniref:MerR family transcriptional regulator, redox-sensitive transcriptional activator SoxR n=1 Tax=Thalassovita taeanensis TaxID=657014 RepID=A0A1H9ART9_9RHOB|nr:redox-sensitive transcriptional activator SoxR [Thalassovita taeanensis]SEP79255.1 MerR family transcriptional regulator, redox-sensitive transcriptional activator SoxR [Thalassovita taeanensis]
MSNNNQLRASSGLPIGALSERTGLAVSAIRYYEAQGLVKAWRNAGGQRRFQRSDIRRLSFVMIAQKFGFSIAEIRKELDRLPDGRTPTPADWARISQQFRAALDARITTLEKLRDDLDGCIGCGCLSLPKCSLYNHADAAHRKGPGPRYLMGDAPDTGD